MESTVPDVQCIHKMVLFGRCCGVIHRKQMSFTVLLLLLGLVRFSRVSRVNIRIRFSFSERVGIRFPDVE